MADKPDKTESDPKARDEVLKRMLKMKPKPHDSAKKRLADKVVGKDIRKVSRKSGGRGP